MQTVKPSKNQLFCKPDEAQTKTASGILLEQKAAERPKTAKVINTGSGVGGFEANDTIIYKPYSISEVKLNGDDFFLVAEEDVLGTVIESNG